MASSRALLAAVVLGLASITTTGPGCTDQRREDALAQLERDRAAAEAVHRSVEAVGAGDRPSLDEAQALAAPSGAIVAALEGYFDDGRAEVRRHVLQRAVEVARVSEDPALRERVVTSVLRAGADSERLVWLEAPRWLAEFEVADVPLSARLLVRRLLALADRRALWVRTVGELGYDHELRGLAAGLVDEWEEAREQSTPWYEAVRWQARLALARTGDDAELERALELARSEPDRVARAAELMPDLAWTRQPAAWAWVASHLRDEVEVVVAEGGTSAPLSAYAADALAAEGRDSLSGAATHEVERRADLAYTEEEIEALMDWARGFVEQLQERSTGPVLSLFERDHIELIGCPEGAVVLTDRGGVARGCESWPEGMAAGTTTDAEAGTTANADSGTAAGTQKPHQVHLLAGATFPVEPWPTTLLGATHLAKSSAGSVALYRHDGRRVLREELTSTGELHAAVSDEGHFWVVGPRDDKVGPQPWLSLWDPEGEELFSQSFADDESTHGIACSADGTRAAVVVSTRTQDPSADGDVAFLSVDGTVSGRLRHLHQPHGLVFLPHDPAAVLIETADELILADPSTGASRWRSSYQDVAEPLAASALPTAYGLALLTWTTSWGRGEVLRLGLLSLEDGQMRSWVDLADGHPRVRDLRLAHDDEIEVVVESGERFRVALRAPRPGAAVREAAQRLASPTGSPDPAADLRRLRAFEDPVAVPAGLEFRRSGVGVRLEDGDVVGAWPLGG